MAAASRPLAKRLALLMGATALVPGGTMLSLVLSGPTLALADEGIDVSGPDGPDGPVGADIGGFNDAEDGHDGGNTGPNQNSIPVTDFNGVANFGYANGGNGGTGGAGIPVGIPLIGSVANGGEGGNGGIGGTANVENSATISTVGAPRHHGVVATAIGGNGGDGGWVVPGATLSYGGDGGSGGRGGTATATTTIDSNILTRGDLSYGLYSDASGGHGGDGGGFAIGIGSDAGDGADGARSGNATAINAGDIRTEGQFSYGILVRAAGGTGGSGADGLGVVAGGGNGGGATPGGEASGTNSGHVETVGNFSTGMLVQSVGGGGGDGGNAFGVFAGGGVGAEGNFGAHAFGNNTGTIFTSGIGAIGMLIESVGGGGGDGGGAVGGFALGGDGAGGGYGGHAEAEIGGTIRTGYNGTAEGNGNGHGSIGVLIQSVGGGGGNGGFAIGAPVGAFSIAIGGNGGPGSEGGRVDVRQSAAPLIVSTSGFGAAGVVAQSIGGGGGNGGSTISLAPVGSVSIGGKGGAGGDADSVGYNVGNATIDTYGDSSVGLLVQAVGGGGGNGGFALALSGAVSVGVGGTGGAGGNGFAGDYDAARVDVDVTHGGAVTTRGTNSHGVVAQSIGGGGGNGGFALALSGAVSVGVGGGGTAAGDGGNVVLRTSGTIVTDGFNSRGVIAQSVGGGGGNGGGTISGGLGVNVGVGGSGAKGGAAGWVELYNSASITTGNSIRDASDPGNAMFSHGIFAQSLGGGGGSGGFSISAGLGPAVSVAGDGDLGGSSQRVYVENTGNIETRSDLSIGLFAQSVGGGGGDGGFSLAVGTTAGIAIGGSGRDGGNGGIVDVKNTSNITTYGGGSHGILAQSVGGGGGNGGSTGAVAVGLAAVSVTIGGGGGKGGSGDAVSVVHSGDITVSGPGAKGILAQSVGGNGGNGGEAWSFSAAANIYPYPAGAVGVAIGGAGDGGGDSGTVNLTADGEIVSDSYAEGSGGVVAQSIGGRGGNGGRSVTLSGSYSPTVSINLGASIGGKGGGGGAANTVTVSVGENDAGSIIRTTGHNANGILAQSVGGGGGNGGDSFAGAGGLGGSVTVNATVTVGGWGGDGNHGGAVDVTNAAQVETHGTFSNAILAQSIGGGGGSGGSASGTTASISNGSNVNVNANVAIGGLGGDGNDGGTVIVRNRGTLLTFGDFSAGIYAQSVGGGGGVGGAANAKAINLGSSEGTTVNANIAVGGGGGDAGGDRDGDGVSNSAEWGDANFALAGLSSGQLVTVENSGYIQTSGYGSAGIIAQSIGGGGGQAGAASAANEGKLGGSATVSVGAGIGLGGGNAGNGGMVKVTNSGEILTTGADSNGITASSVGGGGGVGGAASSGVDADYAIGGSVGGKGGAGGNGDEVEVTNQASGKIRTVGDRSIGIFAQSIGGGGGAGGGGESEGSGDTLTVNLSVGGFADSAGDGRSVTVDNAGEITTGFRLNNVITGQGAHGILAQSIGGGGGLGGAAGTTSEDADYQINLSLSGKGGRGGGGGDVTVTNRSTGKITTYGDGAYGIFAQSIGGGGGASGAGSTSSDGGEISANVNLGGTGAGGADGGTVRVTNEGEISTWGALSHGIFAQSIGGGGGAASSTSNASDGQMDIGFSATLPDIYDDPDDAPDGAGADGGQVYVHHNAGNITTRGDGALGIFAQSVGGSGGYGGSMSDSAAGDDSYGLQVGVNGGNGGNGDYVEVKVIGDIHTTGRLAHGVVAQSVGGGGGYGSNASGKAKVALGVSGSGGDGGNGGDVYVERTGNIVTEGEDSIAIVAQSVGGGGGIAGTSFGRFTTSDDGDGPNEISVEMTGGSQGVGGEVTIIQTGEITTTGARSHGIVAQAVGGGGGIAGGADGSGGLNTGAGSAGGTGNANKASATANNQIIVNGSESYALFGQSATGIGSSAAVTLTAQANLFAQGASSVAAYGESTASGTKGDITVNLNGKYAIGGGGTGVAVMLVGGADNVVNNHSLLYAMGHNYSYLNYGPESTEPVPLNAILSSLITNNAFSPLSITGTGGNDRVINERSSGTLGRVIGNIALAGGDNAFDNGVGASMVGLDFIDLGGGLFTNSGLMTNHGIGRIKAVDVTGGMRQTADGDYVTDIDLNTQTNDSVTLSADSGFAGEAPLNFLSIDRLFGEYVLASTGAGATMDDAVYLTPTFYRTTVGFDFRTRVDNGSDLVLYAEKPAFTDLINDPASGVTDPGAIQMSEYMDGLEGVMSPADPPSELARLINMLRFLPDEATFGETMMRLTPHYAVHTLEATNRSTDLALEAARECIDQPAPYSYDGNCAWVKYTPDSDYERDAGAGTALKEDKLAQLSAGGFGQVSENWAIGATIARTEFRSEIFFKGETLSEQSGNNQMAHLLARYAKGPYTMDFALGGGTGKFEGSRDTSVDTVGYTPDETLGGVYLPTVEHDGIGNAVTYEEKIKQFDFSARFGYVRRSQNMYIKPTIQFDGRWLEARGEEQGSVAAFTFDGPSNFYYSVTPRLEIGADLPISEKASARVYASGGVELSNAEWKVEGQLTAAEGLGAPPLKLTEEVDSPLWRVGAGIELNGVNGVGMAIRYDGAFGSKVEQQSVSAALKVRF